MKNLAQIGCFIKNLIPELIFSSDRQYIYIMKKILAIIAVAAVAAPVYAGCGKKVASVRTLSSYDAATKTLTMKVMRTNDPKANKKATKITITPDSKVMGDASLDKLVGQQLSVISEHGKADYVVPLIAAAKKKK